MKQPLINIRAFALQGLRYTLALGVAVFCGSCGEKPAAENDEHSPKETHSENSSLPPAVALSEVPGLAQNRFDAVVKEIADREDPKLDGWGSEEFNEITGKRLKLLSAAIADPSSLEGSALGATSFTPTRLRPQQLSSAFEDGSTRVQRGEIGAGSLSLKDAVDELAVQFAGHSDIRSKWKTVRVELAADTGADPVTLSHFQVSGANAERALQINAMWRCSWKGDVDPPQLKSIAVTQYEEITQQLNAGRSLYSDCTLSMFRNSEVFDRQLAFGIDHWTDRFDGAIARPAAGHGIAIADVNGDGLDDAYICQSPALPNLLLIQQPDGTVKDTAAAAGVNWLEGTRAALVNDLDNDGDGDLVAVLGSKVVIQANDGSGVFELKAVVDASSSLFAVNAVDFDNDGDLDLFLCGYTLSSGINLDDVFANPVPFQDANNGAPNIMLRNEGNWAFTDVTNEIGLGQNNMRFSYASSWDDYDGDGDLDLYVANDFGRNNLYRNDGAKFHDAAGELGVEDIGPGMSACWGDYNNDGRPDLYVSNMFSSAGNRITHNPKFKTGLAEEQKGDFRRHARGNSLFKNQGDGSFADISVESGVTLGRWAWGSLFADFNNDGWQDLYVANGFITSEDPERDL